MKAIYKNGLIYPQEPIPRDWTDGMELRVEESVQETAEDIDAWAARVQAAADEIDPEDEIILEKTLREIRQEQRDLARREAEKP